LFLKLDIAKAFDTVRWDFLMEVMQQMGFGNKWRSWISILLSTSSTVVMLNGSRGQWYNHFRGLRQGDPLSPMLFILAMEPLQKLLQVAANDGLLSPFNNRAARFRASFYADDAAIFLKPIKDEVTVVAQILQLFGEASGLLTNQSKSAVYPIHCSNLDLSDIMEHFQCPVMTFPCKYLGLPLHLRQLRRVDVQPLIDKLANRLPSWKGKFINRAGRLKLMNSVLSSLPTYFLTMFAPKKWLINKLDKIRRNFFWKGTEQASGGHCLVKWPVVKRPKNVGGLGVLDLELFSRALRLRWMWYQFVDPERPWAGTDLPCSEIDKQLFRASTVVMLGNGERARFWDDCWLNGQAPRYIAPHLHKLAWRKSNCVKDDLINQHWTRGLWRMASADEIAEFVLLWGLLQDVHLSEQSDTIRWKWTTIGQYTSKSA
jgi:mannosylglycoprotein endo-beta-mannosidase